MGRVNHIGRRWVHFPLLAKTISVAQAVVKMPLPEGKILKAYVEIGDTGTTSGSNTFNVRNLNTGLDLFASGDRPTFGFNASDKDIFYTTLQNQVVREGEVMAVDVDAVAAAGTPGDVNVWLLIDTDTNAEYEG